MTDTNKDTEYTQSALNFARSSLFGQVVFHGVLKQLGSNKLDDSYVNPAHRSFEKLEPWINDLYQGLPILSLSWKTPETFEAIRTLAIIRDVKKDLLWLAAEVDKALASDLSKDPDATKLLVAAMARTANTRSAYLEALVQFLQHARVLDVLGNVGAELENAREAVRTTHAIFNTFNRPFEKIEPELFGRLKEEASLVAGDFRSQVHDANLILNAYTPPFSFDQADFSNAEAAPWQEANVSPTVAGYWRAYNFTPAECVEYFTYQLQQAGVAAQWRRAGFKAIDAAVWSQAGFPAVAAKRWQDAGFDPERAGLLLRRGVTDPALAPQETAENEA